MGILGSLFNAASAGISDMCYENYFLPYRKCGVSDLERIAKASYEDYANSDSQPKMTQRACALLALAEKDRNEAGCIFMGEDRQRFFNQFKTLYKSRRFKDVIDNVSMSAFGFKSGDLI